MGIDAIAGFVGQHGVQGDKIGLAANAVNVGAFNAFLGGPCFVPHHVVRKNFHAKTLSAFDHATANGTKTDNADSFAVQVDAGDLAPVFGGSGGR